MRIGSLLLVVWLIIGAIAAGQRHDFKAAPAGCSKAGTIVLTVIAGPLNYVGVDPKTTCKLPQPSK